MLKVNDVVTVTDGSWTLELIDGKLKETGMINNGTYRIVATNCVLPTGDSGSGINDTIIQEVTSKKIIFIKEKFLVLKHRCNTCPTCGKDI